MGRNRIRVMVNGITTLGEEHYAERFRDIPEVTFRPEQVAELYRIVRRHLQRLYQFNEEEMTSFQDVIKDWDAQIRTVQLVILQLLLSPAEHLPLNIPTDRNNHLH